MHTPTHPFLVTVAAFQVPQCLGKLFDWMYLDVFGHVKHSDSTLTKIVLFFLAADMGEEFVSMLTELLFELHVAATPDKLNKVSTCEWAAPVSWAKRESFVLKSDAAQYPAQFRKCSTGGWDCRGEYRKAFIEEVRLVRWCSGDDKLAQRAVLESLEPDVVTEQSSWAQQVWSYTLGAKLIMFIHLRYFFRPS